MNRRATPRALALEIARPLLALAWLFALTCGCSAAAEPAPTADQASAGSSAGGAAAAGGAPATGGAGDLNPLGRARCRAPAGVSAAPQNTEQAVQLLNALPKPTGPACFVESLARPLAIYATSSTFSAQPAFSPTSPRVFIQLGLLWVSVVLAGDSSYLLEFGTQLGTDPPRSVKGELLLPLDAPVPASAPYDRVLSGSGTVCGLCHNGEARDDNITFATAFSSASFRPRPDTRVSVDDLRAQAQACDWQVEPHRCEMLSAVFGGGAVVETPFPATMPTFF